MTPIRSIHLNKLFDLYINHTSNGVHPARSNPVRGKNSRILPIYLWQIGSLSGCRGAEV